MQETLTRFHLPMVQVALAQLETDGML